MKQVKDFIENILLEQLNKNEEFYMIRKHRNFFNSLIVNLEIDKKEKIEEIEEIFKKVALRIIGDYFNIGRIDATIALSIEIAKYFSKKNVNQTEEISRWVSEIITQNTELHSFFEKNQEHIGGIGKKPANRSSILKNTIENFIIIGGVGVGSVALYELFK